MIKDGEAGWIVGQGFPKNKMTIYLVYESSAQQDIVIKAYKDREKADAFVKNMDSDRYWITSIELED